MVIDLLPRLAKLAANCGVTVAARTELTLMRVSSNCGWLSHCSSSLNCGCWVTDAPSNPRRLVAPRPFSTAGIRPSSREGVRNGSVR